MFQGFYSGISGMQTNQYGLDIISDNLANISTTAFKGSTTEFSDIYSSALTKGSTGLPTSNDIGLGSKVQATTYQFQQGDLTPSDRYNDLAIEGNGWFGVTSKGIDSYTRDGHFLFDTYQQSSGDVDSSVARLVTADGKYVQGTMLSNFSYNPTFDYTRAGSTGIAGAYVINNPTFDVPMSTPSAQGVIEFPTQLAYPVEPTTQAQFLGNLGLDNVPRTISADVISAANDRNRLKLTFTKSATQPAQGITWDVAASITSADGTITYDTQNGQAIFGPSGDLSSFSISSLNNDGTQVNVDLGSGFSGVISTDGIAVSGGSTSNGMTGGTLTKYGINADGVVIADFSNGRQSAIARVAVYHFQNDQGLNRDGGTYYHESADSGKPLFWKDANGNYTAGATVRSGMLEASNVRIEVGLTDMIVTQRAYQANAKTITTVDEMIQKALQMHR
ncbi:MAG: flagellar hook-basal body complex protein [Sulfuricurvum sp.]|uniref:flagellar hook protein FlgE n=1 Tax=Sulfuricurvum sp. TaxID=2025608 RepID=UPI002611BCF6|nr:flagellar hook-basal body complex protein [Sulfuricurvum sp.]MDD2828352.1 flagellar hook-basal body complex protein [Sulfuricurvum sp.]MDD4949357.1 flagellar hook-basal body complex protein [Sulfuricurvum sp.]